MTNDTPLSAARQYVEAGFTPLSVKPKDKAPQARSWGSTTWAGPDDPNLTAVFTADVNVGIILGKPSGGVVDIDLDCPEAVALAAMGALPATEMVSGRASAPRSHYWYRAPGVVNAKYLDPCETPDRATLVEVRSDGMQTVVAPSTHPGGERYQWASFGPLGEPAPATLEQEAADLAALSLLTRYWPGPGARHDAYLALAGGLLSLGCSYWDRLRVLRITEALCHLNGDDEAVSRLIGVETTADAIEAGAPVRGFQSLASLFGDKEQAVWSARDWFKSRPVDSTPELAEDGTEEDEQPKKEMRLRPFDLFHLLKNPPPPVPELIPNMLFEGQVHSLIGNGGSGKSLLCLWMAEQLAQSGVRSAYLDHQNGAHEMVRRVASFGFPEHWLADGTFTYFEFPDVPLQTYAHQIIHDLSEVGAQVVFLDSFTDFLKQEGRSQNRREPMSENSNDDVEEFYTGSIELLRRAGFTVVIIDHLGKTKDTQMARGAVIKDDLVQIVYRVKVRDKWNLNKPGSLSLYKGKCRLLQVPERIDFTIDPTGDHVEVDYSIHWNDDDLTPAAGPDAGSDLGPVEDAVLRYLISLEGSEASTRDIRTNALGPNGSGFLSKVVGDFLSSVRDNGHPYISHKAKGKSFLYWVPDGAVANSG